MGTPEFAVASLDVLVEAGHDVGLVVTRPDKPKGRSKRLQPPPVKARARERGIPVYQPPTLKTDEVLERLRAAEPQMIVVVAYGRILPRAVLEIPEHGCWNVHASILPELRGAAPINWAIVRRFAETGVTIMKMDEGLDTGDILLSRSTPIGPREDAVELSARLASLGADALAEAVSSRDSLKPVAQDHERATHAPILRKSDGVVDWDETAEAIDARVRGLRPWPACVAAWRTGTIRLDEVSVGEATVEGAPPGTVVGLRRSIDVSCGGATVLSLHRVTPQGRRSMEARAFANGAHLKIGERLGAAPVS